MHHDKNAETFAAWVGIDWADAEHAVCLAVADGTTPDGRIELSTLTQTPTAINDWATELRDRFGGRPIAVCVEQTRGALMAKHPDAPLFRAIPGAGSVMAPRLLAAFGNDRQRYPAASNLQQASGIAPVTIKSGKSCLVRRRRACTKFLHQTFHEFADHSRRASAWALAYYRMLRARGLRHHAALRALAFKWIRILYRCWKDRTPYDEARLMERLRKTCSPMLKYLTTESPQTG